MPNKIQPGHGNMGSALQSIQQQDANRDTNIKAQTADKVKSKCGICGKYTDKKTSPQCVGHGGGSGGGGGSSGSEEKAGSDSSNFLVSTSNQKIDTASQLTIPAILATDSSDSVQLTPRDETIFNPAIISELLSKGLLTIDNDRVSGILTLQLNCEPNSLSKDQQNELKKLVAAILKELDAFKKERTIPANYLRVEKDNQDNVRYLCISLPISAVYNDFIQQLANKNLLPIQNIEQQKSQGVVYPQGMNHFNSNEKLSSTFSSLPSPWDRSLNGPKPKGWK